MDIDALRESVKRLGRRTLTEAESKGILRLFGIPVVGEAVAATPEEAAVQAGQFGFPVVLKGLGSRLSHKTERGLVHLHLNNPSDVKRAAQAVRDSAGEDLEGYLIQPMIQGRREFVAGLVRDPLFGPVVMFGQGGVYTEALSDVTFRVAPLSEAQAELMLDEIHASPLLRSCRGERAVARDELIRVLTGLSRLAEEWPEIAEVDINPLIAGADGRLTAVDALVVLGEHPRSPIDRLPASADDIFKIFHPGSIAFVGASAKPGKWGNILVTNVLAGRYEGKIFLVNSKGGAIVGHQAYRRLADIPGQIDLGIVTLPAAQVLPLVDEFKAKGIRFMLLITSGFGETGDEGLRMERELAAAAREAGILILGPNTMGISNPAARFYCTGTPCWPRAGSISLLSQSGNLGTQLLAFAEQEGIGIRMFCGSGNEAMITIEDLLSSLEEDPLTSTVVLYVEGIKSGRRFFETTHRVSRKKPVIMLKGGRTDAGSRAAASHSGAMASNVRIFDAACRQAGAILADQPVDLVDLATAFSSLPLPRGRRVGIMTLGGGWGVVATDLCIQCGLEIPNLSTDIIARIDGILPPYWSRENPIDLVGEFNPSLPMRIFEILARWEQCDAIIHLGIVGRNYILANSLRAARRVNPGFTNERSEAVLKKGESWEEKFYAQTVDLMESCGKPILGVMLLEDKESKIVRDIAGRNYKGVAYSTPERAVRALARMVDYSHWLKRSA